VKTRLQIEGAVFTSFILMVMAGAVFVAKDWPLRASIGILVLGSIGAMLAIVQLFFDLRSESRERQKSALEVPQQEDSLKWANAEISGGSSVSIAPSCWWDFLLPYRCLFILQQDSRRQLAARYRTERPLLGFRIRYFRRVLHVPWPSPLVRSWF